ncbi:MAG: hypothetical protein U1F43_28070 [Myxococcota bacterium]
MVAGSVPRATPSSSAVAPGTSAVMWICAPDGLRRAFTRGSAAVTAGGASDGGDQSGATASTLASSSSPLSS